MRRDRLQLLSQNNFIVESSEMGSSERDQHTGMFSLATVKSLRPNIRTPAYTAKVSKLEREAQKSSLAAMKAKH